MFVPYEFTTFNLKNVYMDSSRHVIIKSEPEIDRIHLSNVVQSLTYSKYEKAFNDAKQIEDVIVCNFDKGHYVQSYRSFYHMMVDGIPRAFPTFKQKLDLIISEHNFNLFKGLRQAVQPWLPCNSLNTYTMDPNFAVINGVECVGTRNRLKANELSFFSVKNSTDYNPKIINKRIACFFWQKFAQDHWSSIKPKRKLFVARMGQFFRSMRCSNQLELAKMLEKKYGFELYETDKHTFMENAKAFREASFVIGVHGAALSHLCFCHPEIRFIQLSNKDVSEMFFDEIALFLNFKYRNFYGFDKNNQISNKYNEVFYVPLNHIEKAIRNLK